MAKFFQKIFRGSPKEKHVFCSAVIAAAGNSSRMNGEDKLFIEIEEIPVLIHSVLALENSEDIDEIIVVTQSESIVAVSELCKAYAASKVSKIICGGATRVDSVFRGLCEISPKAELVAIHDGARPLVTADVIHSAVSCAKEFHAAAPAVPLKDTIKSAVNGVVTGTPDRNTLFAIQTPQVFVPEVLKAALQNVKEKGMAVTDDCMAVEALGMRVHLAQGAYDNIKITTPEDVVMAEAILQKRGEEYADRTRI